MARKADIQTLTIEEQLQQAVLPEWEQPYELPDNWVWTKISFVVSFERGITFPASAKQTQSKDGLIPCVRTANVQEELDINDLIYIDKSYMKSNSNKYLRPYDIIMSSANSRELVGKTCYVESLENEMTFGGFVLVIRTAKVESKYLFYYLRLQFLSGYFMGESTQTTNIANINTTKLGNYIISLPPLPEQHRIVERIESLFAKLDEAKELVQQAIDSFETRKAAILHKAFSGKLTAKWRQKNGVELDEWEMKRFDSVATIKSNLVDPQEFQNFPHIAPDNIEKKTGKLLEYCTIKEDGVKSGKHRFYAGQILYSKIRPYLSKIVVIDFDGLCSADMYPIEAKEDTKYLWYYMLSEEFLEQASNAGSRSVLPKINQKELSSLYVRIPSITEQQEIVRILDNIFEQEQQAKELCDILEQIEQMKKVILARLFRGELGTNDPNEESAMRLLKQVLEEKEKEAQKPKPKKEVLSRIEVKEMYDSMVDALKENGSMTPEELKRAMEIKEIDEYYEQLKKLVQAGKIKEIRVGKEVYLEAI